MVRFSFDMWQMVSTLLNKLVGGARRKSPIFPPLYPFEIISVCPFIRGEKNNVIHDADQKLGVFCYHYANRIAVLLGCNVWT